MAKGNLFLGTAARSVGDVVLYRREGAQVSRVRVRKIANPKTDAQCLQRAFMSACVKFYQPLANVLDRSWQGKSRAKSYAAFLKANAPKVRAAGYFIPKGTGFFPLPLQVSEGTIQPIQVLNLSNELAFKMYGIDAQSAPLATIGDLSTLFENNGYKEDDVVTIILTTGSASTGFINQSLQFILNAADTTTIVEGLPGVQVAALPDDDGIITIAPNSGNLVAGTVIMARNVDGVWQRSKQAMAVNATVLTPITSDAAKTACIESYKGAAASDNPLVYLDGDELTD